MPRALHPMQGVLPLILVTVLATPLAAARLPWEAAGLTERQAAAHLLDRFAFGPRPGDIDRLLEHGLEHWLQLQLTREVDDRELEARLAGLDTWAMGAAEIARTFPPLPLLLQEAVAAGVVSRSLLQDESRDEASRLRERQKLFEWAGKRGYRFQRELLGQQVAQKLWRAADSKRQLEAVLLDFWFNHFNVSTTDLQTRAYLLSYERDAILPGVLGKFEDLLVETGAHPAMLVYLDNAQSTADRGSLTTIQAKRRQQFGGRFGSGRESMARGPQRAQGLNENYARELLELHTLGVDGGYTQDDVIEVARAFSGWTVVPMAGPQAALTKARIERVLSHGGARLGFVIQDTFLFRADAHDAGPKTVLGRKLEPGRGIEDGIDVLKMLAVHPSTAKHLARKLAIRFASDEPPQSLVDRLAKAFLESDGDIAVVVRTLAYSPEFWSESSRRQKIKSPFEVAVSALRALDAEIHDPFEIVHWIHRMGQPLYAYQAPTGFPDRAEAWVNTGSLLSRMNFGINLASGRIPGIGFDLAALNGNREPESIDEALATYVALLMPERDPAETLRQLRPVVNEPEFSSRVEEAAVGEDASSRAGAPMRGNDEMSRVLGGPPDMTGYGGDERRRLRARRLASATPPTALAKVVGVILGSPEFQRR